MSPEPWAAGLMAGAGVFVVLTTSSTARRRSRMTGRGIHADRRVASAIAAALGRVGSARSVTVPPRARLPVIAGSAVLAVALGSLVPFALGTLAIVVPWWNERSRKLGLARAVDEAVPQMAVTISRSLLVGSSLRQSLRRALECAPALAPAARRLDVGDSPTEAVGALVGARASDDVAALLALLDVGHHVGGQLAHAFDALAHSITERRDVDAEIRALTSQARSSMVMLAALPFVAASLIGVIEPAIWAFLVGSLRGALCVAVALILDVVAVLWMAAMIRGVQ